MTIINLKDYQLPATDEPSPECQQRLRELHSDEGRVDALHHFIAEVAEELNARGGLRAGVHKYDDCPGCGGEKMSKAQLCRSCYRREEWGL